jgi:hypothetical protein
LVWKPERKRPSGRSRGRLEDNFREIGWGSVEWIHLAKDRDQYQALVNMVMNFHDL